MIALTVAGLALVATGTADLPLDTALSSGASRFVLEPKMDGRTVTSCPGRSPIVNACAAPFSSDACRDPSETQAGCWPGISGTLGYTGTITSYIRGFDATTQPAALWRTCQFIAGSGARVGFVTLGGCGEGTDAARACPAGEPCGYYLYPPFTLEGVASPPPPGVVAPLGPWTVSVEFG